MICRTMVALLLVSANALAGGVASSGLPLPHDGHGLTHVDRAEVDAPGHVGFRLALDYRRAPLSLVVDGERHRVVANEAELRAGLAVGVYKRLALGVWVPVSLAGYTISGTQLAPDAAGASTRYDVASGDIRLFAKVQAVRHRVVGFSLAAALIFPSGDRESWRSNGQWGGDFKLILDIVWRRLAVLANLGARAQPTSVEFRGANLLEIGPELTWGGALAVEVRHNLSLALELAGSESLAPLTTAARTAAAIFSARVRLECGFQFFLGVGKSIDVEAARGDDVRILSGLVWHPFGARTVGPDRDGDGIPDGRDACPNDPEDRDNHKDDDGCPDPDNDGDGILDGADACPFEPEDRDKFQDEDGCPDPDNDKDGVPDIEDWCPDKFGYVDNEGCPDEHEKEAAKAPRPDREVGPGAVYFDSDSAGLSVAAQRAVARLAEHLRRHPEIARVRLEGHADAAEKQALALSESRAQIVLQKLAARGVDPARLSAVGYGAKRPFGKPDENRRVEWIVVDVPQ